MSASLRPEPTAQTKNPLQRIFQRLLASEDFVLVFTALLVGMGAGFGAVLFRYLIAWVDRVGFDWVPSVLPSLGKSVVLVVPPIGGLLVGILVYRFAREAKGHGVPEVMEAVALRGGRIRPIVAVIKALASSLDIGTGGSVGREGPIVQIGAALGSTVGQFFRLADDRVRNLVACGAAGGIAATFNAPIAGVIFALEIIVGEFSVASFSTVVISSVTASVIGQAVFGASPAFPVPFEYHVHSVWEFALYPMLGLLAALVGVLFVKALYWSEDQFAKWKTVPEWLQPAIGGLLLGVMALVYPRITGIEWTRLPQVFNVGYDVIESTLQNNNVLLEVVGALLLLKLLATVLTLGSGGSGGVFAPSLFMGAMLGSAFGVVINSAAPFDTAPPGAYALVGMGAVFAAAAHAPITAVIILFELTGDYQIILPLMLTIVVATLLAQRWLSGESIYTLKLTRRGIRLRAGRDVDVLSSVRVEDVMTQDIVTVDHTLTVVGLSEVLNQRAHRGFPVLDGSGRLWGIVTAGDLERAIEQDVPRSEPVSSIGTPYSELVLAYPDESIGDVLLKMGPRGLSRLPVVSRADPVRLIGLIGRQNVIRAYHVAMSRRSELSHRVKRAEMREPGGLEFVEIELQEGDPAAGKSIGELAPAFPSECVLVSVSRDGNILIPHGSTVLRPADLLTAYAKREAVMELRNTLKAATRA